MRGVRSSCPAMARNWVRRSCSRRRSVTSTAVPSTTERPCSCRTVPRHQVQRACPCRSSRRTSTSAGSPRSSRSWKSRTSGCWSSGVRPSRAATRSSPGRSAAWAATPSALPSLTKCSGSLCGVTSADHTRSSRAPTTWCSRARAVSRSALSRAWRCIATEMPTPSSQTRPTNACTVNARASGSSPTCSKPPRPARAPARAAMAVSEACAAAAGGVRRTPAQATAITSRKPRGRPWSAHRASTAMAIETTTSAASSRAPARLPRATGRPRRRSASVWRTSSPVPATSRTASRLRVHHMTATSHAGLVPPLVVSRTSGAVSRQERRVSRLSRVRARGSVRSSTPAGAGRRSGPATAQRTPRATRVCAPTASGIRSGGTSPVAGAIRAQPTLTAATASQQRRPWVSSSQSTATPTEGATSSREVPGVRTCTARPKAAR